MLFSTYLIIILENITDPSSRSLLVPLWLSTDDIVSFLQSVVSGLLPRLQQLLPLVHLLLLTLRQLFVVRLFPKQVAIVKLRRKVCTWNSWLSSQSVNHPTQVFPYQIRQCHKIRWVFRKCWGFWMLSFAGLFCCSRTRSQPSSDTDFQTCPEHRMK